MMFEPPYPITPLPEDMWDEYEPDPDDERDAMLFDQLLEEMER